MIVYNGRQVGRKHISGCFYKKREFNCSTPSSTVTAMSNNYKYPQAYKQPHNYVEPHIEYANWAYDHPTHFHHYNHNHPNYNHLNYHQQHPNYTHPHYQDDAYQEEPEYGQQGVGYVAGLHPAANFPQEVYPGQHYQYAQQYFLSQNGQYVHQPGYRSHFPPYVQNYGNQNNYHSHFAQQQSGNSQPHREYTKEERSNTQYSSQRYKEPSQKSRQPNYQSQDIYHHPTTQHPPSQHSSTHQQRNTPQIPPYSSQQQQKPISYHPGQQTNTEARQIRREVGHPSWHNPYKDSNVRVDESRIEEYRSQKGHKKKYVQAPDPNESFARAFQRYPDNDPSLLLSSSVRTQERERGVQEVGRFGGTKKKKNPNSSVNSIATIQTMPAKKKEKSLAEEASNLGYFTVKTELIESVVCPFNNAHIMEADRLLTHISRCKSRYSNGDQYAQCPYDPTHYERYDLIEAHKASCNKRKDFELDDNWAGPDNLDNSTNLNSSKSRVIEELPVLDSQRHQELITQDPERMAFQDKIITDIKSDAK